RHPVGRLSRHLGRPAHTRRLRLGHRHPGVLGWADAPAPAGPSPGNPAARRPPRLDDDATAAGDPSPDRRRAAGRALAGGRLADALAHAVLPTVTLCFPALASIVRVNRAEMLEVLKQDYIVNARAQGVSELRIVARYALKNAMIPTLAMIGLRYGWMLGGTVL